MGFLRFQSSSKKDVSAPRWFGGINITSNCRRIEAAMVGVHGRGSGAPVEIRKAISFDLPAEITESYHELHELVDAEESQIGSARNDFFSLYLHVTRELASVEEEAIEELVNESRLSKNDILAIGIHDTGVRRRTPVGLFYQSLCDAPFLAEQTGLNLVDAFPAQDIASHGSGGPVLALPSWIFLKSDTRDRILLDLGRTTRTIFLPQAESPFSHQKIRYRDIVPCGALLDALTWESTQGQTAIDTGGRLTVQGCQIPELLTEYRRIDAPASPWNALGVPVRPFLEASTRLGSDGHSSQDVLCTASAFIAEAVSEQIRNQIAELVAHGGVEPEILLTGSGRLHGMLMNQITTRLEQRPMYPITQLGFPMETFDALCVSMLTLMAVDHIPSNLPALTGCEAGKTLGRITPGSAASWHRLVVEMSRSKPMGQTLRSAV